MSKNTFFIYMFYGSVKSSEMLKKDPFSNEIQNDHTYPICEIMPLPGPVYGEHDTLSVHSISLISYR